MPADTDDSRQPSMTWGATVRDLRLGIGAVGSEVELQLQNTGAAPIEVLSHVQAQEPHLDWYRLVLRDRDGNTRELRLMDQRDKSAPVQVRLEPGATLRHLVSLTDWAARSVNGSQPLSPGTYRISASYETPSGGTTWAGRLEAGPIAAHLGAESAGSAPRSPP